jgi:hypothetical protein
MEIKINTFTKEDLIIQEEYMEDQACSYRSEITRRIIDTREAQVREVLIKLGWTPPSEAQ